MTTRLPLFLILLLLIFTACHKGLAPDDEPLPDVPEFPIHPEGGNPVGLWHPDTSQSVEVTILDEDKIPPIVDSLILDSNLEGVFSFSFTGACSVQASLNIYPTVYIQGLPAPLILTITDTLHGEGPYEIDDDRYLYLPIQTTTFKLDTLGFTSRTNNLDLITLPNTLPEIPPFEGFGDIRFYFVFHLTKSVEKTFRRADNTLTRYKKEDWQ